MKRIVISLSFIICLLFSNIVYATYTDYLNGDKNLILSGGHMGVAWYLDKSSLVVQEYNPPIYRIAVNVLTVYNADKGNTSIDKVTTRYFKYDLNTKKMYSLYDNTWHSIAPVGCMAATGHEFSGEMAFYIAYNMKFYGGKKWLNPLSGSYDSPNFSDSLYKRVDNAK